MGCLNQGEAVFFYLPFTFFSFVWRIPAGSDAFGPAQFGPRLYVRGSGRFKCHGIPRLETAGMRDKMCLTHLAPKL
jgi:hypothetical protein